MFLFLWRLSIAGQKKTLNGTIKKEVTKKTTGFIQSLATFLLAFILSVQQVEALPLIAGVGGGGGAISTTAKNVIFFTYFNTIDNTV